MEAFIVSVRYEIFLRNNFSFGQPSVRFVCITLFMGNVHAVNMMQLPFRGGAGYAIGNTANHKHVGPKRLKIVELNLQIFKGKIGNWERKVFTGAT